MEKSPLHIFLQLVEPPSYADAIFAPPYMGSSSDTEIQSAANGASESQASTSRPQQLVLNISVTEPQKIVEGSGSSLVPGSGSFVSYKVSCVTSFHQPSCAFEWKMSSSWISCNSCQIRRPCTVSSEEGLISTRIVDHTDTEAYTSLQLPPRELDRAEMEQERKG